MQVIKAVTLAGQEVLLGNALVAFDLNGLALGCVAPRKGNQSGARFEEIHPLGETQFNAALKDPATYVVFEPSELAEIFAPLIGEDNAAQLADAVLTPVTETASEVSDKVDTSTVTATDSVIGFLGDMLGGTASLGDASLGDIEDPEADAPGETPAAEAPALKTYTGNRRAKPKSGS